MRTFLVQGMLGLATLAGVGMAWGADAETEASFRRFGSNSHTEAKARYAGQRGFAETRTSKHSARAEALGIDDDGVAYSTSSVFVPSSGQPVASHTSIRISRGGPSGASHSVVICRDGVYVVSTGGRAVAAFRDFVAQSRAQAQTDGRRRVDAYSVSECERDPNRRIVYSFPEDDDNDW